MTVAKSTPRFITNGIQDDSATSGSAIADQVPIHLPRFFLFAPNGPETDILCSASSAFNTVYGNAALTEGSKYFNHQSVFAQEALSAANAIYVHRICPDDAKIARLGLFAEVVQSTFNQYVREDDGTVEVDVNGDLVTDSSTTLTGLSIRWSVRSLTDDELGGQVATVDGTLVGDSGQTAKVYPIMEFSAYNKGLYGSNVGMRMWVPVSTSTQPADSSVIEDELTMLYRFQFVSRPNSTTSPSIVQTLDSETYIDVSFKDGVTNPNNGLTYEASKLSTNYSQFTEGYSPVYGPVAKPFVYTDNLETILETALPLENAHEATPIQDMNLINPFTAISWAGTEYEAIRVTDDSLEFTSASTHYLLDGSDGTMSNENYEAKVQDELTNGWTRESNPVSNKLKFPFSCMYDSGFSLDTKKMLLSTLGQRPDIHVAVCTHVDGEAENTVSEEKSVGLVLINAANLTPESTVYGTTVTRAVFARSVGTWVDSVYSRRVPLLLDLLVKRAQYMGDGLGSFNHSKAYDIYPNNATTVVKDVTHTFVDTSVADTLWDRGLNCVQSSDRLNYIWPGVRTVHSDSTSVLVSDINMMILVDVIKKGDQTWAETVGNSRDTSSQYEERIENTFDKKVTGVYDNRVTIEATAGQTETDVANGYSYTINAAVYANNMATQQTWNVTSYRASDLTS